MHYENDLMREKQTGVLTFIEEYICCVEVNSRNKEFISVIFTLLRKCKRMFVVVLDQSYEYRFLQKSS